MPKHTPNLTDVTGQIDTSTVNAGARSTLDGVSPIFQLERERLGYDEAPKKGKGKKAEEVPLGERFTELAGGSSPAADKDDETLTGKGTAVTEPGSDPSDAAVTQTVDTSGTDGIVANLGGDVMTDHGQVATGQIDTTTELTPSADIIGADGKPVEDDKPKGPIEGDERDEAKKAYMAQGAFTVPQILSHAEKNGHTFAETDTRKEQYVDSLLDAGIAPPAS